MRRQIKAAYKVTSGSTLNSELKSRTTKLEIKERRSVAEVWIVHLLNIDSIPHTNATSFTWIIPLQSLALFAEPKLHNHLGLLTIRIKIFTWTTAIAFCSYERETPPNLSTKYMLLFYKRFINRTVHNMSSKRKSIEGNTWKIADNRCHQTFKICRPWCLFTYWILSGWR